MSPGCKVTAAGEIVTPVTGDGCCGGAGGPGAGVGAGGTGAGGGGLLGEGPCGGGAAGVAGVIVMYAEALLLGSATLVAVMATVSVDVTSLGAV